MGKGSESKTVRRSRRHKKHHEREQRRATGKLGPSGAENACRHGGPAFSSSGNRFGSYRPLSWY